MALVDADPEPRRLVGVACTEPFSDFYARTFGEMMCLARAMVGSPELAEDLVQDAYVRVHRHWDKVREPVPYLRRAVVNACRSHYRRRLARASGLVLSQLADPGAASAETDSDEAHALAQALERLPHRQRAAIVLRYYADLPDADIAAALSCRVGTVASLVHRGLARLKEVVDK